MALRHTADNVKRRNAATYCEYFCPAKSTYPKNACKTNKAFVALVTANTLWIAPALPPAHRPKVAPAALSQSGELKEELEKKTDGPQASRSIPKHNTPVPCH